MIVAILLALEAAKMVHPEDNIRVVPLDILKKMLLEVPHVRKQLVASLPAKVEEFGAGFHDLVMIAIRILLKMKRIKQNKFGYYIPVRVYQKLKLRQQPVQRVQDIQYLLSA